MVVESRTTQEFWQQKTGSFVLSNVSTSPFSGKLKRYLPVNSDFNCVELGAYPGTFLCYLAKQFGYRATAIDYRDDISDIISLFEFNGLAAPEIINKDFLEISFRQYDVVASFGFAEHFNDFDEIISRHVAMVRSGGYLVLSMPHFWGYQALLRKVLFTEDAMAELNTSHNLRVMHLGVLKRALRKEGMQLLYGGYALNAQFWVPGNSPQIRPSRRRLARVASILDRYLGRCLPSCALYSPSMLTISYKP